MRERRKEPREGSEIDPETACIQTVGAQLDVPSRFVPHSPWGSFDVRGARGALRDVKRLLGRGVTSKREGAAGDIKLGDGVPFV